LQKWFVLIEINSSKFVGFFDKYFKCLQSNPSTFFSLYFKLIPRCRVYKLLNMSRKCQSLFWTENSLTCSQ